MIESREATQDRINHEDKVALFSLMGEYTQRVKEGRKRMRRAVIMFFVVGLLPFSVFLPLFGSLENLSIEFRILFLIGVIGIIFLLWLHVFRVSVEMRLHSKSLKRLLKAAVDSIEYSQFSLGGFYAMLYQIRIDEAKDALVPRTLISMFKEDGEKDREDVFTY